MTTILTILAVLFVGASFPAFFGCFILLGDKDSKGGEIAFSITLIVLWLASAGYILTRLF